MADQLVAQAEAVTWAGRAGDAMRERIRERAARLREAADRHDAAAATLDTHTQLVDELKDSIAETERRATALLDDGALPRFEPPAPGHKDWLAVSLPGVRRPVGTDMATIDLGPPRPTPHDLLDGLPRRVALTLPELRFVAERANGAPLPFDLLEPGSDGRRPRRPARAQPRLAEDQAAYAEALDRLHDPAASLSRRGLLVGGPDDGVVDEGLLGALGLLATPTVAVDLDVAAGPVQVKSWHRQSGGAVAALSTQDGLVFELAWFPTWSWAAELARVAVIPEDLPLRRLGRARPASTSPTSWPTRPSRPPGPTAPTWCRSWCGSTRGRSPTATVARLADSEVVVRCSPAWPPRPAAGCARWWPTCPATRPRRSGWWPGRWWPTAGGRCARHRDRRTGSGWRWPGSIPRTSPPSWRRSSRRWRRERPRVAEPVRQVRPAAAAGRRLRPLRRRAARHDRGWAPRCSRDDAVADSAELSARPRTRGPRTTSAPRPPASTACCPARSSSTPTRSWSARRC